MSQGEMFRDAKVDFSLPVRDAAIEAGTSVAGVV